MISAVGALVGIFIGNLLCLLQEYFGFLKMGIGYVVDAYPVITNFSDSFLILLTVLFMGFLAAYYPVKYIKK
jgi:lipoprotein-releasing system permease protein